MSKISDLIESLRAAIVEEVAAAGHEGTVVLSKIKEEMGAALSDLDALAVTLEDRAKALLAEIESVFEAPAAIDPEPTAPPTPVTASSDEIVTDPSPQTSDVQAASEPAEAEAPIQ